MRYIKVALSVLFVLLISFFVVKSCVHPKRTPASRETESGTPFFSRIVSAPRNIVIAPRPLPSEGKGYPAISKKGPRMAIILDDWGKDYPLLKSALEIQRPLTLAIIPNLVKSRQIAEEAYKNKLGVMIHLPMEPQGKGQPVEPHTIRIAMSEKEILGYVDEAFESVPHAEGVNNHMGSAATGNARVMKIVMGRLKRDNLYFIDSHVVPTTKAPEAAKELKLLFSRRDVFIDNENNVPYIKQQLEKAMRIAFKHGEVVVIGHDRKMTIRAIKEMIPVFDEAGIELVYARDVVKAAK